MTSTRNRHHVNAPGPVVYRALLDPGAIAMWRVPTGMTSHVHEFEVHEGGSFRVSLTYDEPSGVGKTTAHTDTYHGQFVELVPNERVVEVLEFETENPEMVGRMTITTTLVDADGGTDVDVLHEGIPSGVSPADNDMGTRMSLQKLAELVEASQRESSA
jgi:uncharacterized protein YndB with AHSA1/START domain